MKYFVRNHIFNNPKNKLQAAIQMDCMEFNHWIIEDKEMFIKVLNKIVERNIKEHPKCDPEKARIHRITGKDDVHVSFGGGYCDGAYFGFILHEVKNYSVTLETFHLFQNLNQNQNDKDNQENQESIHQ